MNDSEVKGGAKLWADTIRAEWRGWLAMVAVVLLGFGLRAAYYHGGYGHPDETITTEVVGHMRSSGDWDTNWAKATNLGADLRYDQYNFSSTFWRPMGSTGSLRWCLGRWRGGRRMRDFGCIDFSRSCSRR